MAGQPGRPELGGGAQATAQSCPAPAALSHLDLQVLVLVQVTGSVPRLLGAKASTADLPKERGVLLLSAEPVGCGDRWVRDQPDPLVLRQLSLPQRFPLPGTRLGLPQTLPHLTSSFQEPPE